MSKQNKLQLQEKTKKCLKWKRIVRKFTMMIKVYRQNNMKAEADYQNYSMSMLSKTNSSIFY